MKTKTHKIVIITLTVLFIVSSVTALFFMPDTVPLHWGANGNADRFGSKYSSLITALIALIICIGILLSAKYGTKSEQNKKSNEKITYIAGECVLTVLFAMNIYISFAMINNVQNIYTLKFDIGKLTLLLFGALMVIMGNFMPKAKRNSYIGFRTPTTMSNDEIWKKSQRFAGICFVTGGFVNIICAIFFTGVPCIFILMAVIFIIVIAGLIYTAKLKKIEN